MSGTTERKLDILVSGAGIAGLTAAYFLLQDGHNVTILERAPELRASGQSVDVRGHALTILQRMKTESFDVEAAVRGRRTEEKGLRFVDAANRTCAEFPVDDGASFTGEIEIMRGDLASILFDGVKLAPNVETVFGKTISSISHATSGKMQVDLSGSWSSESSAQDFDCVIAADGIMSSTRSISFAEAAFDAVRPLGQWSCWFSIPREDTDVSWARWYNAPKGRMILVRPDKGPLTRVSLWTMTRDATVEENLTRLLKATVAEQKDFWSKLFRDAGWEASRVVDGMHSADDFYMQKIAQVKVDAWSEGRVVLVGDSAYCPSPVSGMGVTTAMTGAYVLAGEMVRNPHDLEAAFKTYEEKMRPFVKVAQQLAPGTPGAANPESAWGIWFLYCFLGAISWTKLYKLFGSSVNPPSQAMALPEY